MKIRTLTGSLSRPFAPAAAALAFVLAATACHGSGGGTTQDLEVMRLEITTATPNLAHELGVAVELMAAHSTSDVGLVFLIAAAAEVDAGVPEPALEVVDSEGIAEVLAGNHAYSLRLDIPEDALAPGDYYLIALVDPIGAVPETDEIDNSITADEIEEKGVRITLSGQAQALADVAVESIELDDVLIDVDVTPDAHVPVGGIAEVANGEPGLRSCAAEALLRP